MNKEATGLETQQEDKIKPASHKDIQIEPAKCARNVTRDGRSRKKCNKLRGSVEGQVHPAPRQYFGIPLSSLKWVVHVQFSLRAKEVCSRFVFSRENLFFVHQIDVFGVSTETGSIASRNYSRGSLLLHFDVSLSARIFFSPACLTSLTDVCNYLPRFFIIPPKIYGTRKLKKAFLRLTRSARFFYSSNTVIIIQYGAEILGSSS